MVERLGIPAEEAEPLLSEYMAKYPSELKALQVAEKQGRFPDGVQVLGLTPPIPMPFTLTPHPKPSP